MGAGIGMGNTCKPMAVSFQCMTKSTTIKKIKKIKKKYIRVKKKRINVFLKEVFFLTFGNDIYFLYLFVNIFYITTLYH